MSENMKNVNEEIENDANSSQEQYSLNDDRRVKVLSPGAMVAKRFFRNRLAVTGLSITITSSRSEGLPLITFASVKFVPSLLT